MLFRKKNAWQADVIDSNDHSQDPWSVQRRKRAYSISSETKTYGKINEKSLEMVCEQEVRFPFRGSRLRQSSINKGDQF